MTYLLQALQARAGEFIHLRRDIHQHPELAFEEHRTAALVADKLQAWGYAVERGIGGTGVVGTLVRGKSEKRLGIRADMDALPIDEASGAEWSSVLLIGNGAGHNDNDGGGAGACMVHNPGYDFNDHNVAIGSAYWVLLAQRFLAAKEQAAAR